MKDELVIIKGKSADEFWTYASVLEARAKLDREERWKRGDTSHDELPARCACKLLEQWPSGRPDDYRLSLSAEGAGNIAAAFKLSTPLTVHIPNAASHRQTQLIRASYSALAQERSLIRIAEGLWVVSPEQCLLECATHMSRWQLALKAMEYCGLFVRGDGGELFEREPLTTPAKLAKFAEENAALNGGRALKFVAKFVLGRSRSPRESQTALVLTLPRRHGGHALKGLELNRKIQLGEEAARLLGRSHCEVDGCWPRIKIAYEYQSKAHHRDKLENDSIKRAALERDGWTVISITDVQLRSEKQMDAIAATVAAKLKPGSRNPGPGFTSAQKELFDSLIRS